MIIGGILIEKFGKKRMMNHYFMGMVLLTIALATLKMYWHFTYFIYGFMIAYNILYTFACIGVFSMAMQCCWKKVSASQFTLYMTISNLGRIALAALIGPINTHFSWQISLLAFAVMIGLAWLLLQFLNINKQAEQVVMLENKEAGNGLLQAV